MSLDWVEPQCVYPYRKGVEENLLEEVRRSGKGLSGDERTEIISVCKTG